jgi:uncharacterized membrane protein YcgQ (UPF0703/DUF1980 family)
MQFNSVQAEERLRKLTIMNAISILLTVALFIFPIYQLISIGKVPIDHIFFLATGINIALAVASFQFSSKIKFLKYQINYFKNNEEMHHG